MLISVAPASPTSIRIDPENRHALLLIEEQGRDIEWRFSDRQDFMPIPVRPPRLGLSITDIDTTTSIDIRTAGLNPLPAPVRLSLDCNPATEKVALAHCVAVAGQPNAHIETMRLLWESGTSRCRALLLHSGAAAAGNDAPSALTLYEAALNAWLAIDDRERASAASLGLAERLWDVGKPEDALAVVDQAITLAMEADSGYFAARSKLLKCLIEESGRSSGGNVDCYLGLTEDFVALGEISEAANIQYNLAFFWLHEGSLDKVAEHLRRANAFDSTRLSPLIAGRLRFLASQVELRRGHVDAALAGLDEAHGFFVKAGDLRWQANANLQAARVYEHLSAPEEATVFQQQARRFYEETDAKLRLIAAIELEALLLRQRGDQDGARAAAIDAARRYQSEGMDLWAIDAWLHAADIGVGEEAWRALDELVTRVDMTSDSQRIDIDLARIARTLGEGTAPNPDLSLRLDRLTAQALSIDQLQHARRLQAQALNRVGDADRAFSLLDTELVRQIQLVDTLGSAALRHLALRQARKLGQYWVDTAIALADTGGIDLPLLRSRLRGLRIESVFSASRRDRHVDSSALDAALSVAVLPSSEDDPSQLLAAQRSLLRFYAHASEGETAREFSGQALADQPATVVPEGVLQLTYALGDSRAMVLVAQGDDVVLHEIGTPAAIRKAAARLAALAYRRETPVAELSSAATELAALILPASFAVREPPSQLWIEGEELFAAVPFALLPWPGHDWPLVESTAVSFRLGSGRELAKPMNDIDVIVAARPANNESSGLPWLRAAEAEPALLAATLPEVQVRVHAGAQADRAALDDLLHRQDAWLHIAAHGVSRSGFQGLAGLWLAPSKGADVPEFVSWLGLVDRPLAASLVVLNACQLADTGAAVSSSASFASALAAAGVEHVVAARWQVSDNASTVWVPAFYTALRDDPRMDAASALRQAQLALRQSRQFRHPFYWSGLAHLAGGRNERD